MLNFTNILPIDFRFMLIIGGTKNTDFKAFGKVAPLHSMYLIDVVKNEIIAKRALKNYKLHSACALFKKKVLYIVGGE